MKKLADVECGACGQEELENNKLCKSSGSREEQVKSDQVCEPYRQNNNKTEIVVDP